MSSHWVQKRGTYYVVVQRGSNRVLSRHRSRTQAEASFKAMEITKRAGKRRKR